MTPRNAARAASIIRLEPNVPMELALQHPNGMNVQGQYGPQVMFNLTGNRRLYVPQEVGEEIRSLSLPAFEPFILTKGQKEGQRAFNWWSVLFGRAGVRPFRADPPHDVILAVPIVRRIPENCQRVVERKPAQMSETRQSPDPVTRSYTQIEQALKTAVAAACAAEKFGVEIGYPIKFSEQSIKSMACTVLIGMGKAA